MTKPLTKAQKKEKKDARKSQQQKAPSTTKTTVNVPKPEGGKAEEGANLCDTCAFEFGECEGTPKFGEEEGSDRVVECKTWADVDSFPTADQGKNEPPAPGPAEPPQGEGHDAAHDGDDKGPNEPGGDQGEPRVCDVEHLGNYPRCFEDCPKDECDGKPAELVHLNEGEGEATEEDKEEDLATMRADLPARPDPKRFQDDIDRGACPGCERPLKRTAFNRYRDAIRCTNPRCPQYRAVVKTVGTGVL